MSEIFFHYGTTEYGSAKVLVVSCYHEKLTSKMSYTAAIRKLNDKAQKIPLGSLPPIDSSHLAKETFIEILSNIQTKVNFDTILFTGDMNLGQGSTEKMTAFLFDNTINEVFEGKKVLRILESSTLSVVTAGIKYAESEEGVRKTDLRLQEKPKPGKQNFGQNFNFSLDIFDVSLSSSLGSSSSSLSSSIEVAIEKELKFQQEAHLHVTVINGELKELDEKTAELGLKAKQILVEKEVTMCNNGSHGFFDVRQHTKTVINMEINTSSSPKTNTTGS